MADDFVFRTMREQIADRIRLDVLSGRLEGGANLREITLAKQYGVSRAPIRDALLQLTQEGLLESKPNCGVRVGVGPDPQLRTLIVQLRRQIECYALAHGMDAFTDDRLAMLESSVAELHRACQANDLAQMLKCDMAFHRILVETAGGADLVAIWIPIVSRMFFNYGRHADMLESHREHSAIAEAIRDRDREAAITALKTNIQ